MSIRESPVRTAAMLAANRANAHKSTGPRALDGKRTSAMNALRSGFYSRAAWAGEPRGARDQEAFEALCQTLRVALVAANNDAGAREVRQLARRVWKVKRALDHWIEWESQAWRKARQTGRTVRLPYRMPTAQTLVVKRPGSPACPGWRVKVSIGIRWGRSPAFLRFGGTSLESAMTAWRTWRERLRRQHAVVVITCTGHPWTERRRQRLRSDPESHRKGLAWRNVILDFETDGTESGLVPRDFGISVDERLRPAAAAEKGRLGSAAADVNPANLKHPGPEESLGCRLPACGSGAFMQARMPAPQEGTTRVPAPLERTAFKRREADPHYRQEPESRSGSPSHRIDGVDLGTNSNSVVANKAGMLLKMRELENCDDVKSTRGGGQEFLADCTVRCCDKDATMQHSLKQTNGAGRIRRE